jgi:hypothetical protein
MKLFVDDERLPPTMEKDWVLVRDPHIAIKIMDSFADRIEILSLDHDLGMPTMTGYDIACWLEKRIMVANPWKPAVFDSPKILRVHSANPVGKQNILRAFESIVRFYEQVGDEPPKIEVY